jgi:hypothetical protein
MWWLVLGLLALSYADAHADMSPLRGLEVVYLLVEELSAGRWYVALTSKP